MRRRLAFFILAFDHHSAWPVTMPFVLRILWKQAKSRSLHTDPRLRGCAAAHSSVAWDRCGEQRAAEGVEDRAAGPELVQASAVAGHEKVTERRRQALEVGHQGCAAGPIGEPAGIGQNVWIDFF